MKVMLMGFQEVNFKTRDGDEIDGVKLHYNGIDTNVVGRTAESQFIRRHVFDTFGYKMKDMKDILGTEVNIDFNGKGKIVGFVV
jgi:hypothetical protein